MRRTDRSKEPPSPEVELGRGQAQLPSVSTSTKADRGAFGKLSEEAFIEVMGTKLPMAVTTLR